MSKDWPCSCVEVGRAASSGGLTVSHDTSGCPIHDPGINEAWISGADATPPLRHATPTVPDVRA